MLPKLPYTMKKSEPYSVELRGINRTADTYPGDLESTYGVSSSNWPFITNCKGMSRITFYSEPTTTGIATYGIIAKANLLFFIHSGILYACFSNYDNLRYKLTSSIFSYTYKKMCFIGNTLIVFPDKIAVDCTSLFKESRPWEWEGSVTVTYLEKSLLLTGAKITANTTAATATLTNTGGITTSGINVGDVLKMSGWSSSGNNGYFTVIEVNANTSIVFDIGTATTETASDAITVKREIPNFIYVTGWKNRLCGVVGTDVIYPQTFVTNDTVYLSRMGDFANFFDYSGNANDSYAFDIKTPGNITGIFGMSDQLVVFKNNETYKLFGDTADEFQMQTENMRGALNHDSVASIGGVLYFPTSDGVYAYNGSTYANIGLPLGSAYAGFGTAHGSNYRLYSPTYYKYAEFDTRHGVWIEDSFSGFASTEGFSRCTANDYGQYVLLGFAENYKLYEEFSSSAVQDSFEFVFRDIYDGYTSSKTARPVLFAKKRYQKLTARIDLEPGAYAEFWVSLDGGVWKKAKSVSKSGLNEVPIPIGRCDSFKLKVCGEGGFVFRGIQRTYVTGGVR